ncbi:hypothetical protein EHQ30_06490 [Leptospira brenneri]|uniref:Uncharacterized protein n=1 Tax=Leptospira brenneri TaxID=2023182 RepID=A0A5F1ZC03_9LEPT|nr:hypothetical protein EHQ30_06490 [Leptospira brenneri]
MELALYDLNNFTEHNPDFNKNLKDISRRVSESNFVILLEVVPIKKDSKLNELSNINFYSGECSSFFYEIYRYDYIQFFSKYRVGQRENIYPLLPKEKYQFELEPRMAHVDFKDLPRKRILLYSDRSCPFSQIRTINFRIESEEINSYSIHLKQRI